MRYEMADRLQRLPPYLFARMEEMVAEKKAQGLDMIDFGIGDPDVPTPGPIIKAVQDAVADPSTHTYPSSSGERGTRVVIADYYKQRFGIDLDPDKEVTVLIGSKEGIANICRAFVNPGEKVISPDPAYPVYANGAATLTDAITVRVPLHEKDGFLMRVEDIPKDAKMLYLNYPNNPTGAVADIEYLKRVMDQCRDNGIIFCYDNAYSEMCFDDYLAPSALEAGMDCIEFGSVSKTFNMTGYRMAYAVGNRDLVAGLRKCKSQIDSGTPKFIQRAAMRALSQFDGPRLPKMVRDNIDIYQGRRDVMVAGLRRLDLNPPMPKATFYIWLNIGGDSMAFAEKMLDAGIVVTPGIGFGDMGEGYVRMALTQSVERIEEALTRMVDIL